jgi:hypothetical protein
MTKMGKEGEFFTNHILKETFNEFTTQQFKNKQSQLSTYIIPCFASAWEINR